MLSTLFADDADRLFAEAIHGKQAMKAAERLLASPACSTDAAIVKARAILAACKEIEVQIEAAALELIAALRDAGVEATRAGLGHAAQFPVFRLNVSPDQLETTLFITKDIGYVGADRLSNGGREALTRAGRMLYLMRPDETCMRVALHWRTGSSILPQRLAPDAVDAATLNLPALLWPAYIAWRPMRIALKRLGRVDFALQADAIRPEAHLFTPDSLIDPLLDTLQLSPGQRFLDIGCGDGRIVAAAARRGLDAHGVEMNRALAARAEARAQTLSGSGRIGIHHRAVSADDITRADGIFLFQPGPVFPRLLKTTLKHLKPGARIISHEQSPLVPGISEAVQPTRAVPLASKDALTVAYIWQR